MRAEAPNLDPDPTQAIGQRACGASASYCRAILEALLKSMEPVVDRTRMLPQGAMPSLGAQLPSEPGSGRCGLVDRNVVV